MSKSITDKALAFAKEKEAERLKSVKESFLGTMEAIFEERVRQYTPWASIDGSYTNFSHEQFSGLNADDIIAVGHDLGFITQRSATMYNYYAISVPRWVKGQKKTPAQLMVYRCNAEINRRIKSDISQARKKCKEVLDKIKVGDFETCKKCSHYYITVHVDCSEPSKVFMDEAARVLESKKFYHLSINAKNGTWDFAIRAD